MTIMGNEAKRQLFTALRERERQGSLTPEEKAELTALYREMDEMEASSLRATIERKRQEAETLRALNERLREVIRRKEERLTEMRAAFSHWRAEREELDAELERLLSQAREAEAPAAG
jgi:chromosome segregation ATPase